MKIFTTSTNPKKKTKWNFDNHKQTCLPFADHSRRRMTGFNGTIGGINSILKKRKFRAFFMFKI